MIRTVYVRTKKNVCVINVFGREQKLEFEDHDEEPTYEEEEYESLTQLTLRIPESIDLKLRQLGTQLDPPTNRQGAINYILFMYYQMEFFNVENLK